ncbi:MAG TPA: DUF6569 family protein [Ktedonobacterales bacterium]
MPNDHTTEHKASESGAVATAVQELLQSVRQGEPLHAGALQFIPLLPATAYVKRQTGYLPLDEALRRDLIAITEQAQEQVPELLATSTAETPVILIGGEQVIGGLQNRVLNTTILVPAHAQLHIPVTCVEAGRWHEAPTYADPDVVDVTDSPSVEQKAGRAFTTDEAAYAKLRKLHAKSVTRSLSSGSGHRSDQSAVWGEVAERMAFSNSYSPSSAMQTLYKTPERAHKLKEIMDKLQPPDGALGFIAVLGSEVLGAELFADEALAHAYWEKLARSYAVEALDASQHTDDAAPSGIAAVGQARLLEEALAADIQIHPSPGLGADARLVGSHVAGAGLVYDGAVVHLSLFPDTPETTSTAASDALQQLSRHLGYQHIHS